MTSDGKTVNTFLEVINSALEPLNAKIDIFVTKERCLSTPITDESYENEFPPTDLDDIQSGDILYFHCFLTIEKITSEGFCEACVVNSSKLSINFVNLDAIYPPMDLSTPEGLSLIHI